MALEGGVGGRASALAGLGDPRELCPGGLAAPPLACPWLQTEQAQRSLELAAEVARGRRDALRPGEAHQADG